MKIRSKLIIFVSITLLLGSAIIGTYSILQTNVYLIQSAQEKLKSDLQMGKALINERFPGPWSIKDGQIYKGEQIMDGNFGIVDEIGELTGNTVTIFKDNTRVSTNVKKTDGSRAIKTRVSDKVSDVVLIKGQTYIGEADVVGTINQTAYEPIKDKDGNIIGIWYVGVPNTFYDDVSNQLTNNIVVFVLLQLLIGIIVIWFFATKAVKPLTKITEIAKQITRGNLNVQTINIKSKDELGQLAQAINDMVIQLKDIIQHINKSVINLTYSAQEISEGANQTAITAEQITNSIQAVATGLEIQKTSTENSFQSTEEKVIDIKNISHAANNVFTSSSRTLTEAELGSDFIHQAIVQMNKVDESVQSSIETINMLETQSKEITQILSLIRDVAEQTNLLALNAAIEAARAGEHGKGFTVVASEVRKLAEQTSASTQQVSKLINEIQQYSSKSVRSMDYVNEEVRKGKDIVKKSGEIFTNILSLNKIVNEGIQEIDFNSNQLSAKSIQVSSSIRDIANVTEETSNSISLIAASSEEQLATMEELTALSKTLNLAANHLTEAVSMFHLHSSE